MDVVEKIQHEDHSSLADLKEKNITLRYQEYFSLDEGTQLKPGEEVLMEIISHAAPCKTIRNSF